MLSTEYYTLIYIEQTRTNKELSFTLANMKKTKLSHTIFIIDKCRDPLLQALNNKH